MATTSKGAVERVFDAFAESSSAVLERAKAGNERASRVAATVIREAEWAQQGTLELGRKLAQNPLDLAGFAAAVYGKSVEAQERAFEFARNWVDEMAVAARETRTTVERVARAQRDAAQPAVEAVKGVVSRTSELVSPVLMRGDATPEAPAKSGRRPAAQADDEAA